MITFDKSTIFVFDLDDTLYSERTFEESGIRFVCDKIGIVNCQIVNSLLNEKDWISYVRENLGFSDLSKIEILDLYRYHKPNISLYEDAKEFLGKLKNYHSSVAVITDGRSISQRNKLHALDIAADVVVVSEETGFEKPNVHNFNLIDEIYPGLPKVYFADNPKKDFITPKKLGWKTIGLLDRGNNIHEQNLNLAEEYLPHYWVQSFNDIDIVK